MRSLSHQPAPIRILAFIGLLALLWLPIYGMAIALIQDDNTASIVAMAALFIEFLTLTQWWNRTIHRNRYPWQRYGLQWSLRNGYSLLYGFGLGALSLFLLFTLQAIFGWITWTTLDSTQIPSQLRISIEGFAVAIGIAFGEEMVFRGWLLDELERDYRPTVALLASSLLFAVLHFIKPLGEIIRTFPQFPGLVLLGLLLVWAKRSHQGRLGVAIGLHAGLVWGYYIINVGDRIQYQNRVPDWWSGIDQNPLAGLMGLGFLAILALWFRQRAIVAIRE